MSPSNSFSPSPSSLTRALLFALLLLPRPARAEIYVRGSAAGIVVGVIILLLCIGGGVAGCVFLAKRRKIRARATAGFHQHPMGMAPHPGMGGAPLPQDQVGLLAPPQQQYKDNNAVYGNTANANAAYGNYPPQNTSGYNPGYNNSNAAPYPASAASSSAALNPYPGGFAPPLGPPPPPPTQQPQQHSV